MEESTPPPHVPRPWRYALATAIGSSHVGSGTPCQDASAGEIHSPAGAATFLGIVSDGAGSAPLSQLGARLACQVWREEACEHLARGGGVAALDRTFAEATLTRFQNVLARVARRANRPVRDLACTLLFAAVDDEAAAFAQIGDGAIVVGAPPTVQIEPEPVSEYAWVFWPQQGEYVNQTLFASEKRAAGEMCFERREGRIEELAIFSDGLQGLVLDLRARRAHPRFFEPMFAAVRREAPGRSEPLCRALERFLVSRTVLSRTDDDKSLILASRRAPEAAALPRAPAAAGTESTCA
jgi:protein phosphatase 2C-like protein